MDVSSGRSTESSVSVPGLPSLITDEDDLREVKDGRESKDGPMVRVSPRLAISTSLAGW